MSNPVGIDMGISKRLTMSDGKTVEKREIDRKRLIRLQRSVSRKKKGSNNRRKAVLLLAKEWQRTDGQREELSPQVNFRNSEDARLYSGREA